MPATNYPALPGCSPGVPAPLGPTVHAHGVNFALFAEHASSVELLLFDAPETPEPAAVLRLDPTIHRSAHYWHIDLPGIGHGQVYGWRVHGLVDPKPGDRHDGTKLLLDPYARAVTGQTIYDRRAAAAPGSNLHCALRCVVIDPHLYDWEGDTTLPAPAGRDVIYELHVRSFTASPTSGVPEPRRGTYAGLLDRIDYLKGLGVTAVELMPVFEFDPQDAPPDLTNVWGYSPVSWFAPHSGYASDRSATGPVDEFRDLIKALHRAGLRVILDVVYNHTAEGGSDGPTLGWRGLANDGYYILQTDRSRYADFTGCGNTFNANHPVGSRLIRDSLRYWVEHMHIDGFRFDLASAHARDEDGIPLKRPPVLQAISADPRLARTTLIAEAWDAAGLYQVGNFPAERFAVWNGAFRDDIRRFVRGDEGTIENLMARLVGSPDLFGGNEQRPSDSINYVASHDGFSLRDLVSYDVKHNEANNEGNRDGSENNLSWNCGIEGATDDPVVAALRARQVRNFLVLAMMSHGTPMFVAGDEFGHTRRGNNNPWCQDNDLNHLDWRTSVQDAGLLRFVRHLIAFTGGLRILQENRFWAATNPTRAGDISWHGVRRGLPDWSPSSRALAFTLAHNSGTESAHVMANAGPTSLKFELPVRPETDPWRLVIDTARPSPADISEPGEGAVHAERSLEVAPHSIAVLLSHPMTSSSVSPSTAG